MRLILSTLLAVVVAMSAGCGNRTEGIALEEARSHLTSPKPLRYLTQTMGSGQSGEAAPGGGQTLWYPLGPPDQGKRLVLRFDPNDRLERAEVVSPGSSGKFDVADEVIFDRVNWKQAG